MHSANHNLHTFGHISVYIFRLSYIFLQHLCILRQFLTNLVWRLGTGAEVIVLAQSLTHSFTRSLTCSFSHSFIHWHAPILSFTNSSVHPSSIIHPSIHPLLPVISCTYLFRAHYNQTVMRQVLRVWQDIWWSGRKGWKLNIRADYHNRWVCAFNTKLNTHQSLAYTRLGLVTSWFQKLCFQCMWESFTLLVSKNIFPKIQHSSVLERRLCNLNWNNICSLILEPKVSKTSLVYSICFCSLAI